LGKGRRSGLKIESSDWTEFQTGATTLALHGGGKPQPLSADFRSKAGTYSIEFNVSNLGKSDQPESQLIDRTVSAWTQFQYVTPQRIFLPWRCTPPNRLTGISVS
jgi:hypothetical protein